MKENNSDYTGITVWIFAGFLLLMFLVLSVTECKSQILTVKDRNIDVSTLTRAPRIDSVALTPDSTDVLLDTYWFVRRTYVDRRTGRTRQIADTLFIPDVSRNELRNQAFNIIWNQQPKAAEAEYEMWLYTQFEPQLPRMNTILTATGAEGYLIQTRGTVLPQFVGFWQLTYNGNVYLMAIRPNGAIVEIEQSKGNVRLKPNGITGTVQAYHPRRISLNGLVQNDAAIVVSSRREYDDLYVRVARNVKFERLDDNFQKRIIE